MLHTRTGYRSEACGRAGFGFGRVALGGVGLGEGKAGRAKGAGYVRQDGLPDFGSSPEEAQTPNDYRMCSKCHALRRIISVGNLSSQNKSTT